MLRITSLDNNFIKQLIKTYTSARTTRTHTIIQGLRACATAHAGSQLTLEKLCVTEECLDQGLGLIGPENIVIITPSLMQKISSHTTPSGVIGYFKIHRPSFAALLPPKTGLVCARISDPGNMGTLFRTAAALNISTVIVVEGVDPWSPKVVQATMGSCSTITIHDWTWEQLVKVAHKSNLPLCALEPTQGQSPDILSQKPLLIVVGNEAHGIPKEWLEQCSSTVTLPMPGKTESLNAAVAGSIALYLANYK